eukprot:scaffold2393_cov267-Pinguiococcus_pyrenoidosus.AAC.18
MFDAKRKVLASFSHRVSAEFCRILRCSGLKRRFPDGAVQAKLRAPEYRELRGARIRRGEGRLHGQASERAKSPGWHCRRARLPLREASREKVREPASSDGRDDALTVSSGPQLLLPHGGGHLQRLGVRKVEAFRCGSVGKVEGAAPAAELCCLSERIRRRDPVCPGTLSGHIPGQQAPHGHLLDGDSRQPRLGLFAEEPPQGGLRLHTETSPLQHWEAAAAQEKGTLLAVCRRRARDVSRGHFCVSLGTAGARKVRCFHLEIGA